MNKNLILGSPLFITFMFLFMFFPFNSFDSISENMVDIDLDFKNHVKPFFIEYIKTEDFKKLLLEQGLIYQNEEYYITLIDSFFTDVQEINISGVKSGIRDIHELFFYKFNTYILEHHIKDNKDSGIINYVLTGILLLYKLDQIKVLSIK